MLPDDLRSLASKYPDDAALLHRAADVLEHMARQIELNKKLDEDDLK